MVDTVAIKRLSAVEVDPSASHQREFHADRLGRELGIEGDRVGGSLVATYHPVAGEPLVASALYTYYQARRPPRSEFRLYPQTRLFLDHAHEGDLLLVFRQRDSDALRMVVAERGSRVESEILEAFFARDVPSLDRFQYVAPTNHAAHDEQLGLAMVAVRPELSDAVLAHETYRLALDGGKYPSTAEMARSAREIADRVFGSDLDPDQFLYQGLEAETELYFAIEGELASRELKVLTAQGVEVTSILEWSTRRLNARKSRRGRSLQRHFESLLEREAVPFTPECTTEAPPPVDVMIPSCKAYGDPTYPPERLRAVSCKSTLKERWMEIVPEARRVPEKFVLTLDDQLTDSVLRALVNARVRPFVPSPILASYDVRPTRSLLSSVTTLVQELRAITT